VKIFDHSDDKLAWREYSAMRALWTLNIHHVSPAPLLLLESYIAPDVDVLITEWLDATDITLGDTLNKMQWTTILHTLVEVHRITPETVRVRLTDAIDAVQHPCDFLDKLTQDFEQFQAQSDNQTLLDFISRVLAHLKATLPQQWAGNVPRTLIHGDWHLHNFAFADGVVRFFDWETAGWGDPALDIALLLTHESFAHVTARDQRWLIETYQTLSKDATLGQRVAIYVQLLDVEWLIDSAMRYIDNPSADLQARVGLYRDRIFQRYPSLDS